MGRFKTDDQFRRRLFGYAPSDVHRAAAAVEEQRKAEQDELAQLRQTSGGAAELGQHLAGLLTRFAESVSAGEREATEQAAAIVADAEARAAEIGVQARQLLEDAQELASATFAEAGRQYEAATGAHRQASDRIEDAIEQMADALASLSAIPAFPELPIQRAAERQLAVIEGGFTPPPAPVYGDERRDDLPAVRESSA